MGLIGNNIKQLRKAHSLSQTEFGDKIGVDRGRVAKWETTETLPKAKEMIKICEVFHISYAELSEKELVINQEDVERDNLIVNESDNEIQTNNPEQKKITSNSLEALIALSRSNELLASAHDKQAEANRQQAEANRILAATNAKMVDKITAYAAQESHSDVDARIDAILELLTGVATGKQYSTAEEMTVAYIHILQIWKDRNKGIQNGKGTSGK